MDPILDDLAQCDREMSVAIRAAVAEAAQVCMALASPDTYGGSVRRSGKPSSRAPGNGSAYGTYKRLLRIFRSVLPRDPEATPRWAVSIDVRRERTDGREPYSVASGVPGRPSECDAGVVARAAAMRTRGASIAAIAAVSGVPRSTFYGWLARGRTDMTGAEHALWRACGGSGR